MIMSLCKKGLHSFLGFTSLADTPSPPPPPPQPPPPPVTTTAACKCHAPPSTATGVGLGTATGDMARPPNVLESAAVRPSPMKKKDQRPGGMGNGVVAFADEIGGVVDGLMSCTESLGCESSDEMRTAADEWCTSRPAKPVWRTKWREASEQRKERREKKFPPPISSLNDKGQPNFILRSVRRDGRLELTEVRIDRPEILRASRQDGRLRLDLVVDEEIITEEEEEEKEDGEEEVQEEELNQEKDESSVERFRREEVGEWKISAMGSEGFGRCHELVNHHSHHHHHHDFHVWRQPCVTTR